MYYFQLYYKLLANCVAIVALIASFPVLFRKKQAKHERNEKADAIIIRASNVNYEDILPEDIENKYGKILEVELPERKNRYLCKGAKKLFWESIKRHPFAFHLNFLLFRELCLYSGLIDNYKTKAIVVYVNERNVAAPILSFLCEQKGIEFITFMHGDYILQLIHGYMRFSKFYVWDDHYTNMFINDLKCEPTQFITYTPKKLKGICKPRESGDLYDYYATYYFSAESKKRVLRVAEVFKKLKSEGKKLKIRPHPRYPNMQILEEAFKDFLIEDCSEVTLKESVESSQYIISLNSTVLLEALYSGKEIVIDNYSDKDQYQNLMKRRFIIMNKPHRLFTELLN